MRILKRLDLEGSPVAQIKLGPLAQRLEQRTHNHFMALFRLLFAFGLFSHNFPLFQQYCWRTRGTLWPSVTPHVGQRGGNAGVRLSRALLSAAFMAARRRK
jgi:hypothetical protein